MAEFMLPVTAGEPLFVAAAVAAQNQHQRGHYQTAITKWQTAAFEAGEASDDISLGIAYRGEAMSLTKIGQMEEATDRAHQAAALHMSETGRVVHASQQAETSRVLGGVLLWKAVCLERHSFLSDGQEPGEEAVRHLKRAMTLSSFSEIPGDPLMFHISTRLSIAQSLYGDRGVGARLAKDYAMQLWSGVREERSPDKPFVAQFAGNISLKWEAWNRACGANKVAELTAKGPDRRDKALDAALHPKIGL